MALVGSCSAESAVVDQGAERAESADPGTGATAPSSIVPTTRPTPTVGLEPGAAAPVPAVPPIDPQRTWPGIRDLEPHETLRRVANEAMAPTVSTGDAVIATTSLEPQVGDLILFPPPPGTDGVNDILKRIVASGGQTVSFVEDRLLVDGVAVDEPYLAQPNSTRARLRMAGCVDEEARADRCELPAGTFFVLGDNRLGSTDSRMYGPIAADSVVAVVTEIVDGGD